VENSYEHVKYFCLGLIKLGLQSGDKVAIMETMIPNGIGLSGQYKVQNQLFMVFTPIQ
jgi:hypothetical protein